MTFSGALTITDLDDFLTPSQACIIPVRNGKEQSDLTDGSTEIHIDGDNNYYEVSTYSTAIAGPSTLKSGLEKKALEKAEINLNDCLACSGCITSTESLLITLQSHLEVLTFIRSPTSSSSDDTPPTPETRRPFLSISPQTLASLSAYHSAQTSRPPIPSLILLRRIRHFLSQPANGGWIVGDTTFARHLSLAESVKEFEERKAYAKGKWVDRSGMEQKYIPGPLPVLASACPGWVCYAEKAQGDLLPLMSGVRSSQAIAGGLVKQYWGGKVGLKPNEIYHVTAMPCYDKKLEASRSDFYSEVHNTRDVDCVLTTGELDLLLQDLGFDPYKSTPLDSSYTRSSSTSEINVSSTDSPWPDLLLPPGTSSGSYLHTLISHISNLHPRPTALHTRKIRDSADNEEYILYDPETNEVLFKGAKVYGFRNLQNLVRRVGKETGLGRGKGAGKLGAAVAARRKKKGLATDGGSTPGTPTGEVGEGVQEGLERLRIWEEKKLDYVEVMACPSGCVNGGGQMKPVLPGSGVEGVEKSTNEVVNGKEKMDIDEEGYPRPMVDEGMDVPNPKQGNGEENEEGWRWSTKEWVERVEQLYWIKGEGGLITPPLSPTSGSGGFDGNIEKMMSNEERADKLAEEIGRDIEGTLGVEGRWEFFRTRFRRVVGDILGGEGGVTLEAVRW